MSSVVATALTVLFAIAAFAVVAAPWLIRLFTQRLSGEGAAQQQELATFFLRVFAPQILLYGYAAIAAGLLNVHDRFAVPMYLPILNNLVVIATFLAFAALVDGVPSVEGVNGDLAQKLLLAGGTTAGVAVMALANWPSVRNLPGRLRWRPNFRHPSVKKLGRLSTWTFGYVISNQITFTIALALAYGVRGGATAYFTAFAFFQLPYGIAAVSIMTALVPTLAAQAVDGDADGFRARTASGIRAMAILMIPATAAYLVLSRPLIRTLLQHGVMQEESSQMVAGVLDMLSLGLLPFSTFLLLVRAFIARQDTRTPLWCNLISNAAYLVASFALFPLLGVRGLGLSHTVCYVVAAAVAWKLLGKEVGGLDGRHTARELGKVVAASVVSAVTMLAASGRCRWLSGRRTYGRSSNSSSAGRSGWRRSWLRPTPSAWRTCPCSPAWFPDASAASFPAVVQCVVHRMGQSETVGTRAEELSHLAATASQILGKPAVLVEDLSYSSRAVVARLDLGGGETAIAKRPFERESFTSEVEALRVLPPDTRPVLLGSGDGVMVMEDLGTGPSLADLLLSPAGALAERALESWAGTVGRALRATLCRGVPTAPVDLSDGLTQLVAVAGELGIAAPAGVEDDVRVIVDTLSGRSPWLAYCPGDTCPDNNRVFDDGTVRLFDFEGSGWRHAATEAAYCRAPFCTCWCVATLPAGMTDMMEGAFLDALDPPGRNEFCAAIGLADVSWFLMPFAGYLRRFVHESPGIGSRALIDGRQLAVLRLGAVQTQTHRVPALGELAGGVRNEIIRRWPEAAKLPPYPAFS